MRVTSKLFAVAAVAVCLASLVARPVAAAVLTGVFDDNAGAAAAAVIAAASNGDGSYGNGAADTYYAVAALTRLGKSASAKTCDYLKGALASADTPADAHYAAAAGIAAKCIKGKVAASVVSALSAGLESGNVRDIYHAAAGLTALSAAKAATVDNDALANAALALSELMDDDGTFRSDEDAEYGSVTDAGYALEALAAIKGALGSKADSEVEDALAGVAERIPDLIDMAEGPDDDSFLEMFDPDEDVFNSIAATALVLNGASAFAAATGEELAVDDDQIVKFGEYFVLHKAVTTPEEAHFTLVGLDVINGGSGGAAPLAVTMSKSTVNAAAKGQDGYIRIKVTDIFGKFASAASVFIVSAYPEADEKTPYLSRQEVFPVAETPTNTEYQANFVVAKPDPGFYVVTVDAEAKGAKKGKFIAVEGAELEAKVMTGLSVRTCSFAVSDSKDPADTTNSRAVSCLEPSDEPLSADQYQHIHVSLASRSDLKRPYVAHQVFVTFANAETGSEVTFTAKPGDGASTVHINLDRNADEFESVSGEYDVTVTVGDAFVPTATVLPVGKVSLTFVPVDYEDVSDPYAPKPAIEHIFRTPESLPPAIVSLVGTGAALAPILVLLVGLGMVGANISGLGDNFLMAVGFHGSIGAILGLYTLYWLSLDMFTTLRFLAVLAVAAAFFGSRLLSSKAQAGKDKTEQAVAAAVAAAAVLGAWQP